LHSHSVRRVIMSARSDQFHLSERAGHG
jgi:hypothetical protein